MRDSSTDALIALIRGECHDLPDSPESLICLLQNIDLHGVCALILEKPPASDWPAELADALQTRRKARAIWELQHRALLGDVVSALCKLDIEPIFFKGTALAYNLYPNPILRIRSDSDLIVPESARSTVTEALKKIGFGSDLESIGAVVGHQSTYIRTDFSGNAHALDVHWRINNSEVLSRLFSYQELREKAQPLQSLAPQALAASSVHALLLACMHRATHRQNPYYVNGTAHYGGNRLIWLYDIHLLAGELTLVQWQEFTHLADLKGLRAVCLEALECTRDYFPTSYPESVMAALVKHGLREPAAHYLDSGPMRQQWLDFIALPTTGAKTQFLRKLLLPPAEYMRRKYPEANPRWLPWLYLHRATTGLIKRGTRR